MFTDTLVYNSEIIDFICAETLYKIDYGILDLSKIPDCKLREVLYYHADLLEVELKLNYLENPTGIFRVRKSNNRYYYEDFEHVIEADSIEELRELVLNDSGIWYVFDEIQAKKLGGD